MLAIVTAKTQTAAKTIRIRYTFDSGFVVISYYLIIMIFCPYYNLID